MRAKVAFTAGALRELSGTKYTAIWFWVDSSVCEFLYDIPDNLRIRTLVLTNIPLH